MTNRVAEREDGAMDVSRCLRLIDGPARRGVMEHQGLNAPGFEISFGPQGVLGRGAWPNRQSQNPRAKQRDCTRKTSQSESQPQELGFITHFLLLSPNR